MDLQMTRLFFWRKYSVARKSFEHAIANNRKLRETTTTNAPSRPPPGSQNQTAEHQTQETRVGVTPTGIEKWNEGATEDSGIGGRKNVTVTRKRCIYRARE